MDLNAVTYGLHGLDVVCLVRMLVLVLVLVLVFVMGTAYTNPHS